MRNGKARGIAVTCEVAPHHFILTDDALEGYDTNVKMNPPLREAADRDELVRGLVDGSVDVIATDHAPHHADEKRVEFDRAPFGIVGLETCVPLTFDRLVHTGLITLTRFVELLSVNPARILGVAGGALTPGAVADVSILAPDLGVTIDAGAARLQVQEHAVRRLDAEGRRRRHHRRRPRRLHQPGRAPRPCLHPRVRRLIGSLMPAATPAPAIFGGPKPSTTNMTDRHFVTRERARKDMESLGVLMTDGHFDYGNGFHGRVYLNAHQLFRHPSTIWRLAQDLLDVIPSDLQLKTEVVAGPATGGALLAHTIAGLLDGRRSLSHPPCAFAPFQYDTGDVALRPFYAASMRDRRVLLADDVRNTGKTLERCAALVREAGGEVLATVQIYDRLESVVDLGVPNIALIDYQAPENFPVAQCPLCQDGTPITVATSLPRRNCSRSTSRPCR